MTKKAFLFIVLLSIISGVLFAFVSSFSNLYGSYPSFNSKSYKPTKPFIKDSYYLKRYSDELDEYIQDAKNYIAAAKNDIQTIEDNISDAINDANDAVNEYNSYIRNGF